MIATDPTEEEIFRYRPMVWKIAGRLRSAARLRGLEMDDLLVEGLLAVRAALRSFRPDRGCSLPNYVWKMIHWRFGVVLRDAKLLRQWPVDQRGRENEIPVQHDYAAVDAADEAAWLKGLLLQLPPRHRIAVSLSFGLDRQGKRQQWEIAEVLGVTRQRVQQLVTSGLKKLVEIVQA